MRHQRKYLLPAHCIRESVQVSPGKDLVMPRHFPLQRYVTGERNQRVRKGMTVAQGAQEENLELKALHQLRAYHAPPKAKLC